MTLKCFALWLYELKFQMISEYSKLVQFQSSTQKFVLFTQTVNFYVFCMSILYNSAKITKQCKHCTKLELIFVFYHTVFELRLVHEKQISTSFLKLFA